ncbi:hypothetical protein NC652_000771 [Populus alba x Populus x berolinensis]|uniref:Uncharacterized protein n=1 Tax=Populus alba x Populus x berolinensis TaxID=444605 RepID=A0AAD6WEU2_9ROSI|nr:hypothetical protein NC652_000771 [Populus alba x Populus x berolinensis]KAJ7010160.1 hypothetical protein NC653_000795 [Populus alba x Populus x berolinensis]
MHHSQSHPFVLLSGSPSGKRNITVSLFSRGAIRS